MDATGDAIFCLTARPCVLGGERDGVNMLATRCGVARHGPPQITASTRVLEVRRHTHRGQVAIDLAGSTWCADGHSAGRGSAAFALRESGSRGVMRDITGQGSEKRLQSAWRIHAYGPAHSHLFHDTLKKAGSRFAKGGWLVAGFASTDYFRT